MKTKAKNKRKNISIFVVALILIATTLVVVGSQGGWFQGSTFGLKAQPPKILYRSDLYGELYHPSEGIIDPYYSQYYHFQDSDEIVVPFEIRAGSNPVRVKYIEWKAEYACKDYPAIPGYLRYSRTNDYYPLYDNPGTFRKVRNSAIESNLYDTSYIFKYGRLANIPEIRDSYLLAFILKPAICEDTGSGDIRITLESVGIEDTVTGKDYKLRDILFTDGYYYLDRPSYRERF